MTPRNHDSEILVLGLIAIGVMILAGIAIRGEAAPEASAWTAVLMAIISTIKDRWTQRGTDRMADQLGQSVPRAETPMPVEVVNAPAAPVPVEPTKPD